MNKIEDLRKKTTKIRHTHRLPLPVVSALSGHIAAQPLFLTKKQIKGLLRRVVCRVEKRGQASLLTDDVQLWQGKTRSQRSLSLGTIKEKRYGRSEVRSDPTEESREGGHGCSRLSTFRTGESTSSALLLGPVVCWYLS
jgi:hypothetical protein